MIKNTLIQLLIFSNCFLFITEKYFSQFNETGAEQLLEWEEEEFLFPDEFEKLQSVVDVVPDFFYQQKDSVFFSHGNLLFAIPFSAAEKINIFATDGEYFILNFNEEYDFVWKAKLFVGAVGKDKNRTILKSFEELKLSLSHEPQSINFIRPGLAIITTIMEYNIIEFDTAKNSKIFNYKIKTYNIPDGQLYSNLSKGISNNPNLLNFSSAAVCYYLDKREQNPRLKKMLSVFDLDSSIESLADCAGFNLRIL